MGAGTDGVEAEDGGKDGVGAEVEGATVGAGGGVAMVGAEVGGAMAGAEVGGATVGDGAPYWGEGAGIGTPIKTPPH